MVMTQTNRGDKKMKATHMGTCQVCHAGQKLPQGHLSIHGYTVNYGWFNGTCRGSHRLPVEQSCDIIQESIALTVEAIGRKETKIEEVENSTTTYYYERNRFRGIKPIRMEAPVDKTDPDNWTYEQNKVINSNPHCKGIFQVRAVTERDVANSKESYVMKLRREIRAMNNYITAQAAAVKNWEPKPLTEIK
jgi:hypothetical protein